MSTKEELIAQYEKKYKKLSKEMVQSTKSMKEKLEIKGQMDQIMEMLTFLARSNGDNNKCSK